MIKGKRGRQDFRAKSLKKFNAKLGDKEESGATWWGRAKRKGGERGE